MPAVTGIYWTDAGYAECRAHLVNPSWRPGDLAEPAVKAGVILTGPVDCDACREARPWRGGGGRDICTPRARPGWPSIHRPRPPLRGRPGVPGPLDKSTSASGRTGTATCPAPPPACTSAAGRRNLARHNGFFRVTADGTIEPLDSAKAAICTAAEETP